jgi:kinesin family protein 18/19
MFGSSDCKGFCHLAMNDIFESKKPYEIKNFIANIFMSFYQVYAEQAFDLLANKESVSKPLSIRVNSKKGVYLENLTLKLANNLDVANNILNFGLKNRSMRSTYQNAMSSRSHAVLQFHFEIEEDFEIIKNQQSTEYDSSTTTNKTNNNAIELDYIYKTTINSKKVRKSVLTFVDLAGSERTKKSQINTTSKHLKESILINKSICALGNCIKALSSASMSNANIKQSICYAQQSSQQQQQQPHIPYRDSRLTRLLEEPLGGNSKICLIATIGFFFAKLN